MTGGGVFVWPFRHLTLPTADLYLHVPMRAFIADGQRPFRKRPIVRLGPHLYAGKGRAVLVRYATRAELWRLARMRPERCAWLIDDNLWALEEDAALPEDYRARLLRFRERMVPRILSMCDTVIAPNEKILKHFPRHHTALVHPSSVHVCRDLSHFDEPRMIEAVFAGTRSHLPDLAVIADALRALVESQPRLRLTTFLGQHVPQALQGHERIVNLPPMPWERYREEMRTRRFHLGIAVFRDTLFNRSRSVNKILDHAAFGAAGVYTDAPPFAPVVTNGENGVLVAPGADLLSTLGVLLENVSGLRKLAEGGVALASRLGDPAHNRAFWMEFFRIGAD